MTKNADTSTRLVRMPADLHRRLKVLAATRGKTITGLLSQIVGKWLGREEKAA